MPAENNGNTLLKKLFILEIFLYELFVLIMMEVYKYYINLGINNFFSRGFFKALAGNFKILYIGNLIWILLFVLSILALINIYRNLDKIKTRILTGHFIFSLVLLLIIIFSVLPPASESIDNFTGSFIQLNIRGTKIIGLSLFVLLNLFFTISLANVAFTALKKMYIFRNIWFTVGILVLSIFIVFMIVYNYKDDYEMIVSSNKKADAGVVLGAAVWGGNRPSPVLKERINKAFELYKSGIVKYMVVTGGGSPGELTEGEVSRNELVKRGMDEKSIFMENKSISTLEQIAFVNNNLYKKDRWQDIILITDNFHLLRSKQICNFFGIKAYTVSTDTPLSTESTFTFSLKESFAIILFWLFGVG